MENSQLSLDGITNSSTAQTAQNSLMVTRKHDNTYSHALSSQSQVSKDWLECCVNGQVPVHQTRRAVNSFVWQ